MKAKEQWRCMACEQLHDNKSGAQNCCRVENVWVCGRCNEEHDSKDEAEDCCGSLPEGATGILCLCGAHLHSADERESRLIGEIVRCARCREKIMAGIPSGEAIRQSFIERGIEIR
jgi:hypothetical protein